MRIPGGGRPWYVSSSRTVEARREADDTDTAVAALSRGQETLQALGAQSASGRLSAAAAAGAELASSESAASAVAPWPRPAIPHLARWRNWPSASPA